MAWLRGRRPSSVARQILVLQLLVVLIVVLSALALAYLDARADQRRQAGEAALAVATTTADSPQILAALATRIPVRSCSRGPSGSGATLAPTSLS